MNYSHLQIPESDYPSVPFADRVLSLAGRLPLKRLLPYLQRAVLLRDQAAWLVRPTAEGYSDEATEVKSLMLYRSQLMRNDLNANESGALYEHVLSHAADALSDIRHMLNFGTSYGYIDHKLASRFPEKVFIGIDRSEITSAINQHLCRLPNLTFRAGDIFEYLNFLAHTGMANPAGILFHPRILCLLSMDTIQRLYQAVRAAGFAKVWGIEQIGLSRLSRRPYGFSDYPQDSIAWRDRMFIHNYPGLLKEAGYAIEHIELVKTGHPHPDYRLLSFIARAQ